MLRVDEHVGASAFEQLQVEWEDLADRAPDTTPFQTWRLARGAWRMNQDTVVPRVFAVRESGGRAVAILPIGMTRGGLRPLQHTEARSIAPGLLDDTGVLVDAAHSTAIVDTVATILQRLRREGHLIDIRPIPATNPLAIASERLGSPFRNIRLPANPVGALPSPPGSWEQVVLDAHTRSEVRRSARRLQDTLGMTTLVATTDVEIRFLVDGLIPLHVAAQALKGRVSKLASAAAMAWFAPFMIELHARGEAEGIGLVSPDHQVIAAVFFVRHRGRATLIRSAFDPEYRSFSPGLVALAAAMDRAIALGDREVSFGPGAEAYKTHWATPAEEYVRLTCLPRTPRYLMARAWQRVRG